MKIRNSFIAISMASLLCSGTTFAQVPAGGEVAGDGIKGVRAGRGQTALIAQPFRGSGHVVIALSGDAIRLGNRLGAARDGQEQELGKIMAVEFARGHAAE